MDNLKYRSPEKELLDADDVSFADIKTCMKELNTVNTLLGGHSITLAGIKEFKGTNSALHICEIGCGGGDNLVAIAKKYADTDLNLRFTGVDIKKECIEFAAQQYPHLNVQWVTSDYSKVDFGDDKPDVIFSSLFCHHFKDEELVKMLQWMYQNSISGFFINDLQRNSIAYYLIKALTAAFSKSHLVKHDAPLSVARGFTKKDWKTYFVKAGITNYSIQGKWAFRYLIVCKK